ncbi:Uncharacterised protein [Enterobacter cancerogenus]|uniref:Uncharacterized protein n=1 Tax=Enterobacter cancerogenus TaxID=69218 RepID=A0A484Z7I9_9ENTR|nr:Uncharacterised protein [Enterobacter cancerogenus]
MQLVHKLMGMGAQGVHVVHHAVDTLHELADLCFITERADRTDNPVLAFHRHHVTQQKPAVAADLPILTRHAGFRHLAQACQQRFAGVLRLLARWQQQNFSRGVVHHRHATMGIHRDNPFAQRLKHRLPLFKQGRNFIRLQPKTGSVSAPGPGPRSPANSLIC